MQPSPLVSCLCVTHNRAAKLRRAVACFLAQSYPNKELVVVHRSDDEPTLQLLKELEHRQDIVPHALGGDTKRSLGDLRNISIRRARGEYFCQWDDDDWYHSDRIEVQLEAVLESHQAASLLTNLFIFDVASGQAYFSHLRLWEGTLLCRREDVLTLGLKYPTLSRMEDSFFVNALIEKSRVYPVASSGLYIYEVHRSNSWNERHFKDLFAHSQPLGAEISKRIAAILAGASSPAEGSAYLRSPSVLRELNHFHFNRFTMTNQNLLRYGVAMGAR